MYPGIALKHKQVDNIFSINSSLNVVIPLICVCVHRYLNLRRFSNDFLCIFISLGCCWFCFRMVFTHSVSSTITSVLIYLLVCMRIDAIFVLITMFDRTWNRKMHTYKRTVTELYLWTHCIKSAIRGHKGRYRLRDQLK